MALPYDFSEVRCAGNNIGPYYYGGNYYRIADLGGVYKAISTPDSTWTEMDYTNIPDPGTPYNEHIRTNSIVVGDSLHVVSQWRYRPGTITTTDYIIQYGEFDLSTDSWVTGAAESFNAHTWQYYSTDDGDDYYFCDIAIASNSDIFLVYTAAQDSVKGDDKLRVDYSRYNGSTWSHNNALDAAGDIHYGTPVCTAGSASGDVHMLWARQTSAAADPPTTWADYQGCTYDNSAGSLSTTQTGSISTTDIFGILDIENLSGVPYILYSGTSGTDRLIIERATLDGSGLISSLSSGTNYVSSSAYNYDNLIYSLAPAALAYDSTGGKFWAIYSEADSPYTIHVNSEDTAWDTWSTSTSTGGGIDIDGVSAISCNIFSRSGQVVLGYIYRLNNLDVYYDEYVISGSATVEGAHTFSINTDQTEVGIKTISAAITYLNNLYQNQDKYVSIEEALNFIIQVAQQESQETFIPLQVDLNIATNFILQNILTGEKSITIGALLDQFSQKNLQTYQQALFDINLSNVFAGSAAAAIEGTVSFGSTLAYLTNNFATYSELANISVVLDKASQVYRLFEESSNFSFTLNFDPDYLSAAVFDDPYYGSPDNYIFVDLTNIALISGAIKSASITFTTSQGQQQTVGLIGQAAQTLVVQLIQNQVGNKITDAQNTLTTLLDEASLQNVLKYVQFDTTLNLDKLSSVQEDALKSISYLTNLSQDQALTTTTDQALNLSTLLDFNTLSQLIASLNSNFGITLDQTSLNTLIQLAEFSTTLSVDQLSNKQVDALKTANYLISQSQNQSLTTTSEKTLDLSTILDINTFTQLVSNVNVDFTATLNFIKSTGSDISAAITFLSSLDFITDADSGIDAVSNFNINLLKTIQVQSILNPTITLLKNLSQAADKQAVVDKAIQYLMQLSVNFASDEGLVEAVSFIMQMQDTSSETLTVDKAASIIINLAKQNNVSLTTAESLALIIQLADSYSTTRTTPAQFTLSASMQQLQSTLVDKLITISFGLALDHISTSKVDFNAFSTLISAFTSSFLGDAAGTISAFVTFASQIRQDNTSVTLYNKDVALNNILSESGISNLDWYKTLNIALQLDQTQDWDLGLVGAVIFNTFHSKLATSKSDFRPSIDFNLQAIEAPQVTKDMLTNALLSVEQDIIVNGNRGIVSLVNFGLEQGYETDLRLTAEGEVQLTTQLSESNALNYLGQAGITIGHLLGLTALSRADFAASIAFGTISDLSVDGFVLKFILNLPDGRTFKVYFEDRIKIIGKDGREIKVY